MATILGRRSERRAARLLRRAGLRILARNVRTASGEIDLLAREGDVLVIVEVRRRRAGVLTADLSVDGAKERRLLRAAGEACRRFALPPGLPIRFDLVLFGADGRGLHRRGALGAS